MAIESDKLAKQVLANAPGADNALANYLVGVLPRWIRASFERLTPQDVDELTSLVTIHILAKIGMFKGESTFDTWARTVTRNQVNDWLAKRARRWKRETSLDSEDAETGASLYNAISVRIRNPRQELDLKEIGEVAAKALAKVKNRRQKLILTEYYVEGLRVVDIAERWGETKRGKLDVLLCQAKKVYFEIMKEMLGGDRLEKCSARVLRK